VTVTPLGNGRYEVVTDSKRTLAYAVRRRDETWVFIDGHVYVIEANERTAAHRGRHHDEAALSAPMPSSVLSIHVTPGQTVKAGDVLVTLEAMKMELAVTAPHDARVRAIVCRVGELVQPGVPLVELE